MFPMFGIVFAHFQELCWQVRDAVMNSVLHLKMSYDFFLNVTISCTLLV